MSVLIKNINAAKTCDGCVFYDDISHYCDAANRRLYMIDRPKPRWCPVVQVEEDEDGKL